MIKSLSAAVAVLCCAFALPTMAAEQVQFYPAEGSKPMPFSPAVKIGNMVYTSGVIGMGPDHKLPADFAAQADYAMQAVAGEMKLAGASMDDVFKCEVALTDIKNWAAFNTVYVKYFKPGHFPVRIVTGVSGLAGGAALEVQCQAYLAKS